ncbi:hypothetical protein [Streptomyces sp. NPDC049040]|uniref:hypothetical protein n=1 Tax=Streptomyces sp. NPDC049040 TaxID=3365593 RepID=UPI00371C34A4
MPQDETPDEDSMGGPSAPLTRLERSLAGLMGILMVGGGTAAVFTRKVEAGPTALITVGALLVVIAISGVAIKRAKIGDSEITLHNRQAAAMAISRTPADELDTALSVLAAYDPAAVSDPSIRMAISGAYDSAVLSSLERKYGADFSRLRRGAGFDAEISFNVGVLAIEILHFPSEGAEMRQRLKHMVHNFTRRILENDYERVAVISNIGVPQDIRTLMQSNLHKELNLKNYSGHVRLVFIDLTNPSDSEEIGGKLSDAFPNR